MTKTKCQREFEDLFTKEKGWDLEVYDYLDGLPDQPRYSDDSTYRAWIGFKEGYKAALASQKVEVTRKAEQINSKEVLIDSVKIDGKIIYKRKAKGVKDGS